MEEVARIDYAPNYLSKGENVGCLFAGNRYFYESYDKKLSGTPKDSMKPTNRIQIEDIFSSRIRKFQKLMRYKIRDIMLVSSLYDYYLFEEDGRLYELIRQEFQVLNLSQAPEITHVTTGAEAIEMALYEDRFDLVIVTLHIEDMHPVHFTQMLRKAGKNMPVILLAYDNRERRELTTNFDASIFDRIFIWQGDYRLIIAIIKSIEDKFNVENDTLHVGVQSIILVEDNVKFYSSYLPIVYREIFNQSQRLISEGINLTHKYLRMRARPKILLCTTYEEAWAYFEKYNEYVLGVITDVNFKHNGVKDPRAGLTFAQRVREEHRDIPILIQSSNSAHSEPARKMEASFLLKGSPHLLHDLRSFMVNHFGFGDFVFMLQNKTVFSTAKNLKELEEQIRVVPDESIMYHAERNHFSSWLKARTEFWLAHRLRPQKVTDFRTPQALREEILSTLRVYFDLRQRGITTDFDKETFDVRMGFARIGQGSLGGKARGLGFINSLINNTQLRTSFPGIEIHVPATVVITTDIFDRFMEDNHLWGFAIRETVDYRILEKFLHHTVFPGDIISKLRDFLEKMTEPLAVRSSSLLEDSQFQPFAGVYETYMIPNNHPDIDERVRQLEHAIKCVYASTFFKKSKDYVKSTEYGLEEEKMAVVIQRLVGTAHGKRFYPDIAGVAKSYNFYPAAPQKATDGIADIGFGLGKVVVEGGNTLRFCPRYPKHVLQFFSARETLRSSQQKFFALEMDGIHDDARKSLTPDHTAEYEIATAENDGTLIHAASTYSPENDAIYDGTSRNGKRVITFSSVLKHNSFPLADILQTILKVGVWGMGTQVELEFAVCYNNDNKEKRQFALLQMRPLVISMESEELLIDEYEPEEAVCETTQFLGNGVYNNIRDIVVVDYGKFDRAKSKEVALEISKINERFQLEKIPYLLIGVGRWGSMDPWLGIPVTWDQISGASVIIESGFRDFAVTPSQGSHFFQNLTSFRIGYLTVDAHQRVGTLDWDWLMSCDAAYRYNYTRHLHFETPVKIKLNSQQGKAVILKPASV